MHEASIVSGLMTLLLDQAAQHAVDRISRVTVRVGKLRAVEPRALAACFEVFAEGTMAERAELVVDVVPIGARCQDCQEEFEVAGYVFRCARCQGSHLTVTSGEELYIESFET